MPTDNTLPRDYEQLAAWHSVIRRVIRDMVVGNSQLVTLQVVCDEKRNPILWGEPIVTQLEPRARKIKTHDD